MISLGRLSLGELSNILAGPIVVIEKNLDEAGRVWGTKENETGDAPGRRNNLQRGRIQHHVKRVPCP